MDILLPSAFWGSILLSVPAALVAAAAIPGCREEAERSRRMLSHRQAGGTDRRSHTWGPCWGFSRAMAGRTPGTAAPSAVPKPWVALLRSRGWWGTDNICPCLETLQDVLGRAAGGQR